MDQLIISPATEADVNDIKKVIESTDLFPSELLDDMMASYLNNTAPQEMWLVVKHGEDTVAAAFCSPEAMAEGTNNLYMIAVHKDFQDKGIGSQLMSFIEMKLAVDKVRLLIVETAGTDAYILTREFYEKLGYDKVGHIPHFYSEGEDKIIFCKSLV